MSRLTEEELAAIRELPPTHIVPLTVGRLRAHLDAITEDVRFAVTVMDQHHWSVRSDERGLASGRLDAILRGS